MLRQRAITVGWTTLWLIASMLLGIVRGATADGRPQALVVVLPLGDVAEVSVTFPAIVQHTAVRDRLGRLARAGGWTVAEVVVRDEKPNGSLSAQTGAVLRIIGGPIARNGGFILQPFLETFRDVDRYEILYFVPAQPGFVGLRDYKSAALTVRLAEDGGAESNQGRRQSFVRPYRYVVENLDRSGSLPVIPLTQPVSGSTASPDRAVSDSPGAGGGLGGAPGRNVVYWPIVVLAAGSGLFVYGVLRVLARR
jgi:hypothetical protein